MNIFQNILDIYVVKRNSLEDDGYRWRTVSYHKDKADADKVAASLPLEGRFDDAPAKVIPVQATNINGKWHLLGNIITL